MTEEQKNFIINKYSHNGELRVSTYKLLENKYPDLYKELRNKYKLFQIANIIAKETGLRVSNKDIEAKCVVCGEPALWNNAYGCYRPTCSAECGRKLSASNLGRTLQEEYGVVNSSQIEKTLRTKRIKLLDKIEKRIAPEYEFVDFKERFYKEGNHYVDENGAIHEISYLVKCNNCDTVFKTFLGSRTFRGNLIYKPACPACVPRCAGFSLKEKEVVDYIKSIYKGTILENVRSILSNSKELDIYLPDEKLAIEFDGLAFHCEDSPWSAGKCDKNYHKGKTDECNSLGIDLIHIFENDWDDKKEIVKSIIRHKLGLKEKVEYSESKEITESEAKEFFKRTNLFNYKKADKNIGLFSNSKLIAVGSTEGNILIRFSQDLDYEIENALDYLDFEEAVIDRRYFTGKSFCNSNYFKTIIEPSCRYTDHYKVINKLKEGYSKIWDCGSILIKRKANTNINC